MSKQPIFAILLFSLLPIICYAETVYVTDLLRLNMYELPKSQGKILKSIISGDTLKIITRQPGYAKVRTSDNIIGWTKSAYLVTKQPPRLIIAKMERLLAQAKKQSAQAISERKAAIAKADKQQQLLLANEAKTNSQFTQLTKLKLQNQEFEQSMKIYASSIPMGVYLVSVVIFFILGIAISWYIIDYRIRKRHGGFRLY